MTEALHTLELLFQTVCRLRKKTTESVNFSHLEDYLHKCVLNANLNFGAQFCSKVNSMAYSSTAQTQNALKIRAKNYMHRCRVNKRGLKSVQIKKHVSEPTF